MGDEKSGHEGFPEDQVLGVILSVEQTDSEKGWTPNIQTSCPFSTSW